MNETNPPRLAGALSPTSAPSSTASSFDFSPIGFQPTRNQPAAPDPQRRGRPTRWVAARPRSTLGLGGGGNGWVTGIPTNIPGIRESLRNAGREGDPPSSSPDLTKIPGPGAPRSLEPSCREWVSHRVVCHPRLGTRRSARSREGLAVVRAYAR